MQVKFYVNTQKTTKHGDHPIYLYITYDSNRIRRPVPGVHSSEKNWDDEKQKIRKAAKADPFDDTKSFNQRLDFIKAQVKLIQQEAFDRRVKLTDKYILDRLNDESLIKADHNDFFKIADQYIDSIKPVKANRTILGKTTVFNFLKSFQEDKSYPLSFHKMDMDFFEALRKYAFQERRVRDKEDKLVDGTIEDNYFAKIITVLKTFLNWAFERDYIRDQTFKKFKSSERETEIICLTLEEFLALYNHEFKTKRLSQVRDMFVFGCSTGLRFSDLISLEASHIQGDFIVKNIQKTQENSMIPLNKYSKGVLKKYKETVHEILPKVSHQKFNEYLKECCKEVGIDTPITITRFSGSKRKNTTYPKYELITSHAARKTFATLSLLMGVPERVVKNITGHKKEENFKRYVNFTKEYEKKQMDDVWDKIWNYAQMIFKMQNRINDPTKIDAEYISKEMELGKHVIVQFSDGRFNDKMLAQLDILCKKFSSDFGVRFYGHYSSAFDFKTLLRLPNVKCLYVDCLTNAVNIETLGELNGLEALSLGVFELQDMEILALPSLKNLQELIVTETRSKAFNLGYLKDYKNLRSLIVGGHTKNIDSIGKASKLNFLSFNSIKKTPVPFVNELKDLRTLKFILGGREDIREIEENEIENLEIIRVRGFKDLASISSFKKLKTLLVEDNIQITEIHFNNTLKQLKDVKILNCQGLNSITGVKELTSLEQLRIFKTAIDFDAFIKQERPKSLRTFAFGTWKKNIDQVIKSKIQELGYTEY